MKTLCLVLGALLVTPHRSPAQDDSTLTTQGRRIDSLLARIGRYGPGCAVGLVRAGNLVLTRPAGLASIEAGAPITGTTLFNAGSMTKQFTAAALFLLVDAGRVSLDDDVHRYVPELPNYHVRVTLRELLHHTSGIKDDGLLMAVAGWDHWGDVHTERDALRLVFREPTLNFRPGDRFLYSDSGYDLLALIVERVSGLSFRAFVERNIFAPLGMTSSHISDAYSEVFPRLADGYVVRAGVVLRAMPRIEMVGGSGLITSVADLAKWDAEFYTGSVGGLGLVDSLLRRGVLNSGDSVAYAGGLELGRYRGMAFVEHDGADGGYVGDMIRFTAAKLSIIVLCNLRTNPTTLARRIADIVLTPSLADTSSTTAATPVSLNGIPRGDPAPARGLYYDAANVDLFTVRSESAAVFLTSYGGTPVLLHLGAPGIYVDSVSEDAWVFRNHATLLIRYRTGQVADTTARVSPSDTSPIVLDRYVGDYASTSLEVTWRVLRDHDRLEIHRPRGGDIALVPVFAGGFLGEGFLYRFLGDRSDSLVVSGDRLQSVTLRRNEERPTDP